ncbi:hypothetical protein HYH02_011747 [Chlamydomonas schloesseri]|uniref:Alpha-amylase n=1 Tax=Chlamydomonas schloesseri TaxID=2026947 RepID=A0A835TBW5_9CHLO|nr:hypothetical protein HYH02_011747 [Chlamydomonas schloesseri]|eukprot:KAG2436035.1 hypothetical protein HYH02_011747 [Chlamydomonas schloesseri]
MSASPMSSMDGADGLDIMFDNNSDAECTVVTVEGKDKAHLLMSLTGGFSTAGLTVISASITSDDGRVLDVFRVQTADGKKVPEDQFPSVREHILSVTATTSRSSMPAIYGIVAAAEVERLKPLRSQSTQNDVDALELAAAEMAQAAAELVSTERDIIRMRAGNADSRALQAKEASRTEAAAGLERKMAAMQAVLAARRNLATEPEKPKSPTEKLLETLKPPTPARAAAGAGSGSGSEILLQAFNWESHRQKLYKQLQGRVKDISDAGFTGVWMPPPSDSVSPQGYLPRDLYSLDSAYGSEGELRELITAFHQNNIKVIADIVVNHRCANSQGSDGKWNKFGGRLAWDASAICSNNPSFGGRGNPKQGDDYAAAPNIDHSQERIRNDIVQWMKYLRNSIGFDGWRFDFVRGYLGSYCKQYIDETVPAMAFGEYWDSCEYTDGVLNYNQDAHRQRTVNWCDSTGGTSAAFDFTTKGILQEAVGRREYWRLVDSQGRPPGVMGMWPSRAITFIDNHDTGSTLNHWPFPSRNLPEGYAYILTHPGTPCVFYDHFYQEENNLRKAILDLLKVRRRNGINARSKVVVKKSAADVYAALIDDKVAVKLGPGDWSPNHQGIKVNGKELKVSVSGFQFAVWEPQQ